MRLLAANGYDNRNTLFDVEDVLISNARWWNFTSFAIAMKIEYPDSMEWTCTGFVPVF